MPAKKGPKPKRSHRARVQSGYDLWSDCYDTNGNPTVALDGLVTLRLLGAVRGRRIADIGCGTGRHSLALARRGARVTGIDVSPGMLKKAQAKPHAGKVDFVCHDVSKRLPVKDSAFDKVLSSLVLEHIENLRPFFRELKRICRKKGSIVISTMHPAMMLRGTAARFTDPKTGRKVYPGSFDHKVSDIVMSAMREGLTIEHLGEHSPDARLARRYPKAKKYIGWPMLLSMVLRP